MSGSRLALACFAALLSSAGGLAQVPRENVGPQPDGRIVVPTNQVLSPIGRQISFPGRPVDVAVSPDGKRLGVLNRTAVQLIEIESGKILGSAKITGASYEGLLFSPDGKFLYASTIPSSRNDNRGGNIVRLEVEDNGELEKPQLISVQLPGAKKPEGPTLSADGVSLFGAGAFPVGLAFSADGKSLWAAQNLGNTLVEVSLETLKPVRELPTGNAPYDVVLLGDKAYVSNFAGPLPKATDRVGPSGKGAGVKVDARYIASEGTVSVIDMRAANPASGGPAVPQVRGNKEIQVGLHPCGLELSPDKKHLVVANANSDTLSVIDTAGDSVVETISVRPAEKLLFGSAPNSVAFSPDGKRLYAANGANNAIAVIDFAPPKSKLLGCFPTGWYPAGIKFDAARNALVFANVKGVGSRDVGWEGKRIVKGKSVFGFNSHDYLGTVSIVPVPPDADLAPHTQTVLANNRLTEAESALAPPRKDVKPLPVPQRHGEPSVFEHVLYVIKENRTYDQVFGDMPQGEGDPQLCIYGENVTPNHHKLAREFTLLDNFYCSGVLSADGHQWTDEAFATSYIEKAFGGFPRSYPYDGEDALAYASSGFLWDNALARGRTLRVYGEFVKAAIRWRDPARRSKPTFLDCLRDYQGGNHNIEITARAAIKSIEPHLCPTFIGFPATVSDVYRAGEFIEELDAAEKSGKWPNLMVMLLPNDHTAGTTPGLPTPDAAVADNDLALGRIVEAVSKSRFWPKTCIMVVQDDPQNGFDHVDGHRTVAFAVSPYTRRGHVDSTNYNQTSMVRTIELMLGLPPMNQFDSSATPMTSCFASEPNLAPYSHVENRVPLDKLNPSLADIRDPRQLHWAKASLAEPLAEIDEADEDTLNRILWHAARGRDDDYPAWAISVKPGEDDDDD